MNDPVADNPALEAACLAYMQGNWPTGDDDNDLDVLRNMEAALAAAKEAARKNAIPRQDSLLPKLAEAHSQIEVLRDQNRMYQVWIDRLIMGRAA